MLLVTDMITSLHEVVTTPWVKAIYGIESMKSGEEKNRLLFLALARCLANFAKINRQSNIQTLCFIVFVKRSR